MVLIRATCFFVRPSRVLNSTSPGRIPNVGTSAFFSLTPAGSPSFRETCPRIRSLPLRHYSQQHFALVHFFPVTSPVLRLSPSHSQRLQRVARKSSFLAGSEKGLSLLVSNGAACSGLSSASQNAVAVATTGETTGAKELPKNFEFSSEERIYNWWGSQGCFRPDSNQDGEPFVVSMPPPNGTGALHMGHAMFVTLQDIMTRHYRTRGRPSPWLPGTDHAGIGTQLVVEKLLASEGVKRTDIGREESEKRVWDWKGKYGDRITNQLRRLGASCDSKQERCTLDENLSEYRFPHGVLVVSGAFPDRIGVSSPLGKGPLAPVVAVGLSGGVDSSVAAMLLKRQGFRVFGLYMRNWDPSDEAGGTACTAEQDYKDARQVAKHLGIELYEVDNQRRYWTEVFESFTSEFSTGLTPNPDLACNRYIKFHALLEQAKQLGADKLATGHYARVRSSDGQNMQLLRGVDQEKDQSYFLASVDGNALRSVLFPLGCMVKPDVRKVAISEGLITAKKRSSAGICFVGRRNFADFISEYVDSRPGPFIAVNTGAVVGTHDGIPAYTHGQRARIGGKPQPWYVVGKDVPHNSVFVAEGPEHPALFCTTAVADSVSWISGALPAELANGGVLRCQYKARYRQPVEECVVCLSNSQSQEARKEGMGAAFTDSIKFMPSSWCRLRSIPVQGEQLQIKFLKPARAITPGQAFVLYDGEVCLGASRLLHPGPSLFEQEGAEERVEEVVD